MRSLLAIAALVLGGAGLVACAGDEERPTTTPTAPVPGTIGPDSPLAYPAHRDPSTPIHVALGRRFALSLDARPAEGRRWQATGAPDPAILRSLGTEFSTPPDAATDAPAIQSLLYAAAGEGETTITVTLVEADGRPVPDQEPLTFTVVVSLTGEPPPPPDTATTTVSGDDDGTDG